MRKLFAVFAVILVLVVQHVVAYGYNAPVNECYLRIKSSTTLEYSIKNVKASRIILDASLLEYRLADDSYIVFTLGYPPLNLYGFAIIRENNTTLLYSIRGSQNHWHAVNYNISGNVVIIIDIHNKILEYELLSNGVIVDNYATNISSNVLELRNIVITIASPYNLRNSWITFKKLVVTANNNIIIDLEPNNNTLTEIKEEGLLYPNSGNIELVCMEPITVTKTITQNYTMTLPANSTTKTIVEKENHTITLYNTITTTIVKTITTTKTRSITTTKTSILTKTLTAITTSFKEVPYIPIIFYGVLSIFIALILALFFVLFHRR